MLNSWKVIINPNAGGKSDAAQWEQIYNQLRNAGLQFHSELSNYHKHSIEIVHAAINKGYRNFIVVGGDGSLNEAVNGFYTQSMVSPTELTLAQLPLGTGNDWQKTHNPAATIEETIQRIKIGKFALQDVGLAQYYDASDAKKNYFANVAGMGFDAYVVVRTNRKKDKKARSKFAYLFNLFTSLMSYKCVTTQVSIDGQKVFADKLFSFNVGIGKYNGGGMMQVPDAITDDGLLDVTLFKKISKIKVVANVKRLYDGSFRTLKEVSLYRGRELEIISEDVLNLECDGETLGHTPVSFSIIPLGLRYIC
ncbi:MAG: diacylglycerol kinase family protein [Bacteroidota bacterium]